MHDVRRAIMSVCVGVLLVAGGEVFLLVPVWGQGISTPLETKTIVGDLLMVDRDLYIVRGVYGEIQIEATHKTEISEEFEYGDKIKALVLMNNKALRIQRAGPKDVTGVVVNQPMSKPGSTDTGKGTPAPMQPDTQTIVAEVLMIDGDFFIVRSDYGEVQIEVTPKTKVTDAFKFGDRIKALVLMNNKALTIDRAGTQDKLGIFVHKAASPPVVKESKSPTAETNKRPALEGGPSKPSGGNAGKSSGSNTRVVEGDVLMVDGDYYILRGPEGEMRIERTPATKMSEEFDFGDRIKATVLKNDKALSIERAK